jgi:hypothetical protein
MIEEKPIITVKTARKLLGKSSNGLSDDQIRELLVTLQLLARQQLGYNGSKSLINNE